MFWVITQFHGRQEIAGRCLEQLAGLLPSHAELHAWDDHSPGGSAWAAPYGTIHKESKRLGRPSGIEHLRRAQMLAAMAAGVDEVYLTDTDAMHDPAWYARALELYKHGSPVCLYNSPYHVPRTLQDCDDYLIRQHASGISWYFRRPELERIAAMPHVMPGWDWRYAEALGNRCIVSKTSYVEHYGAGGVHNKTWGKDMALNPTPYLVEQKKRLMPALRRAMPQYG